MVYVLLAITLFGVLTATLASQNNQADGQDIDDELVELYANELIEYAAAAKNVVDQMIMTGSTIDDLDFVQPNVASFDTAPHVHKVYHPQGGGLNYQETFSEAIHNNISSAWTIRTNANVEWTTTAGTDVILSAYSIKKEVCEKLNEKITGSTTMTATINAHDEYFLSTSGEPMYTTDLPGAYGMFTLCVENDSGNNYTFYTVIAAR